ncbi:hypothetical protein R0135_05495 [Congregibacter variabilis]|uniref:Lipoprotein n=1 Tax=Congregibacter variabilis TaxID=3081200 RepID=A0ABZ0I525_9GAMM|nr:hypothetical protein R0135_05495 [Congregibacter sp. IMCC43200]
MRISVVIALLSLALLQGGCTQWYYEMGEALPESFEQDAQGKTLANVLAELGPPLRFATSEDQLLMAWEAWEVRRSALGLSLGWAGADFLNFDWGSAEIEGDYLIVTFDADGRVSAAQRVHREESLGGGAAIQPFYSFVSVVDVQDLLQPLPQHGWGASQLLTLPQVLNNPQSPGMGDTGIEQRGTPLGAGARTLEWLE